MNYLVQAICDYAPGDMAWAEVFAALSAELPPETTFHLTPVQSFDTVSTGFVLAQLALGDPSLRPKNLLVFANTAPRKDLRDARQDNEGEGLLFATLSNGVPVVAVNSGYSLAFVRDELAELWSVKVPDRGSQFRSRDFFPRIVGAAVRGDLSFRGARLDAEKVIPDPPVSVIGYIDSFGNLKTTLRSSDEQVQRLTPGRRVQLIINNVIRTATVAVGTFNVMEGDLAFAPGSSGRENRFWEIFKRGGSAAAEFGRPAAGDAVILTKLGSE